MYVRHIDLRFNMWSPGFPSGMQTSPLGRLRAAVPGCWEHNVGNRAPTCTSRVLITCLRLGGCTYYCPTPIWKLDSFIRLRRVLLRCSFIRLRRVIFASRALRREGREKTDCFAVRFFTVRGKLCDSHVVPNRLLPREK